MNFFANFGRVYPLSTTSISKIKPSNHVSCVLKHLFDIYLRLLPVFSINRGVGGRGGGQRFRYVTEGGGILLTLRTVTRSEGGPNFRQKQRYVAFE